MFSMIPCSSDCIYQVDGYCTLETPTIVTNISNHGCVHRIQVKREPHHLQLGRIALSVRCRLKRLPHMSHTNDLNFLRVYRYLFQIMIRNNAFLKS